MATKLKRDLDLMPVINKAVKRYEGKLGDEALRMLYPQGIKLVPEKITQEAEFVKHYSVRVWTVRYDGKLLFRRHRADLIGIKYKYESPVFGDLTE